MPSFTTKDGTEIYYKDWGNKDGQPITFSHGWPLSSDDWDLQMFFLARHGYRVIAHDRRGHGRSSQPWDGNDMDTYTDDLAELFEHLDLSNAMMVGHSTGGGEVARFLGRHGSSRVSKAVLISSVTPVMIQSEANPNGTPMAVFDGFRAAMEKDRAQFFIDVPTGPFFGFNRSGSTVNQGMVWKWWKQGMDCGFIGAYDCVKAFSETDMSQDLKGIDIPVLILHGDDDQVVPIDGSARSAIGLLKHGKLVEIPGGPHALHTICADEVNMELLKFLKS